VVVKNGMSLIFVKYPAAIKMNGTTKATEKKTNPPLVLLKD